MHNLWNGSLLNQVASEYGTPLYVYSEKKINEKIRLLKDHMHPAISWFYSLKANPNPSIVKVISNAGFNLELCSPYELQVAKMVGLSSDRMMYLGPGKSVREIEQAIKNKIKYFIVESFQEMLLVNKIAVKKRVVVSIGIRINPKTFIKGARLQMGGKPRQFGIDEEQLDKAMCLVDELPNIVLEGIHSYHGTRILQANTIVNNISYTLSLANRLIKDYDLTLSYVDVGGGLGVAYFEGEKDLDIALLGAQSYDIIEKFIKKNPKTQVLMETGRYLTADSGSYLTEVLYTKQSQGIEFAILNGGTHHFGASGTQGNFFMKAFPIQLVSNHPRKSSKEYHLGGPLCTPNDLLGKKVTLPTLKPGDIIEIQKAGAYGLTASPILFLSHPLPREILIRENSDVVVIRDKAEYTFPILKV